VFRSYGRQNPTTDAEHIRNPGLSLDCVGADTTSALEKNRWKSRLLLYPEDPVFGRLGDAKLDHCFRGNLYLLLSLGIKAGARFSLLLNELAKTRQDKFASFFRLFVCERTECFEEYSGGSFAGLGGGGKRYLDFSLRHVLPLFIAAEQEFIKGFAQGFIGEVRLSRGFPPCPSRAEPRKAPVCAVPTRNR
jgi:hypothetical protein